MAETGERDGRLVRAVAVTTIGDAADSITLDSDQRHRRRLRLLSDGGEELLLDLEEARMLRDGDLLALSDGRRLRVRARAEPVAELRADDPQLLARIAWHLGNRHTPAQLLPGAIRIRPDHVLEAMVTALGGTVTRRDAVFDPESGAYAGGHHRHDHDHAG